MTKPFTQKHFGKKGTMTDDSHSFKNAAAKMMSQSPVFQKGVSTKQQEYGPQQETKEEKGKRVYKEAMSKIKAQKAASAKKKKQEAREQRSSISVSMGLGTGRTSGKIKLPRVSTGMGTSRTTHKFKM